MYRGSQRIPNGVVHVLKFAARTDGVDSLPRTPSRTVYDSYGSLIALHSDKRINNLWRGNGTPTSS
jgi:hypothetical protein